LLLTKRIDRVEDLIPDFWKNPLGPVSWPRNVWLGFSAEDQANFDSRWPVAEHLARRYFIPVLFCSAEPLLGPIDIAFAERCPGGEDEPETRSLDWLIVGGESGPGARDCNIMWIADLVNQARGFEIPVFVKQVGSRPIMEPGPLSLPCEDPKGGDPSEWPECLRLREFPEVSQ
jgi:protein gp37